MRFLMAAILGIMVVTSNQLVERQTKSHFPSFPVSMLSQFCRQVQVEAFPMTQVVFNTKVKRHRHTNQSITRLWEALGNEDMSDHEMSPPPEAERDESRHVSFGRQALEAEFPSCLSAIPSDKTLLDPPRNVPDPYGWMRLKEDASELEKRRVLDHIANEKQYTEQFFASPRRQNLYQSLVQEYESLHAKVTDESDITRVYLLEGYYYYQKRVSNQPYPLHCRVKETVVSDSGLLSSMQYEQILLDENQLAARLVNNDEGVGGYFAVHTVEPVIAADENIVGIALSVDLVGSESYSIYFQRFQNPDDLVLVTEGTSGTLQIPRTKCDATEFTIFYAKSDPNLCRPYQWVKCHFSNTHSSRKLERKILYTESEESCWGHIQLTSDGRYVLWISESPKEIKRILAFDTKRPNSQKNPFPLDVPFQKFFIDHGNQQWWILNTAPMLSDQLLDGAHLLLVMDSNDSAANPIPLLLPWDSNEIHLSHLVMFADHVVFEGRQEGLQKAWVSKLEKDGTIAEINTLLGGKVEDSAEYVALAHRQDYHSNRCLIASQSMLSPPSVVDVHLGENAAFRSILKTPALRNYQRSDFKCQRIMVPSRDGEVQIPVSLVYPKNISLPAPMHLLGYGAYGSSLEPSFTATRIPLLQRGVICAVAHVRGGGEMGQEWYLQGKEYRKQTSIHDFCDVAGWMIENNWTGSNALVAEGRSAGGLLVAATMNESPHYFRACVLGVPFLDVLISMGDPTLPLTLPEWEEWGNPHTISGFQAIQSYAPLHNVRNNTAYPSCYMIGGMNDPRAPYWEPLKFAAALRHSALRTKGPTMVKIDSGAGHSFGSNRTKYFQEIAQLYTFVLSEMSILG